MAYDQANEEQGIAYDLRSTYAKIVGEHLIDIAAARKDKKYPLWFNALEDLYTIVKHKFKPIKIKKETITYYKLKKQFITLANKYSQAYTGNSAKAEEIGIIEKGLRQIEMHLYKRMDKAKMFGSKRSQEGL